MATFEALTTFLRRILHHLPDAERYEAHELLDLDLSGPASGQHATSARPLMKDLSVESQQQADGFSGQQEFGHIERERTRTCDHDRAPTSSPLAPTPLRLWQSFVFSAIQAALASNLFEPSGTRFFVIRIDAVPDPSGAVYTPLDAARQALARTRDGERGDNVWYVYDTYARLPSCLVQEDLEPPGTFDGEHP